MSQVIATDMVNFFSLYIIIVLGFTLSFFVTQPDKSLHSSGDDLVINPGG